MRKKRILSTVIMSLMVVLSSAENNYIVTSSSRLNVRRSPSTGATVLGTFESGRHIEVISVNNGWAKVRYNDKFGYVNDKYITPLPKQETPVKTEEESVQEPTVAESAYNESPENQYEYNGISKDSIFEVDAPLAIGSFLPDALNMYLAIQGGVGWSNFLWDNGSVNGSIAYSGNLLAQLYFEDKVSFIPQNWYSEIALGYNRLGAANFNMNYIHLGVCPFGYRIPIVPISIVVKAGIDLSYPLSDLETYSNSWGTDFQCGILGGLQLEWDQFAIGCQVIYDFTEVSSSCNQTLNNIGVLGTLSYKFGKFGHKK